MLLAHENLRTLHSMSWRCRVVHRLSNMAAATIAHVGRHEPMPPYKQATHTKPLQHLACKDRTRCSKLDVASCHSCDRCGSGGCLAHHLVGICHWHQAAIATMLHQPHWICNDTVQGQTCTANCYLPLAPLAPLALVPEAEDDMCHLPHLPLHVHRKRFLPLASLAPLAPLPHLLRLPSLPSLPHLPYPQPQVCLKDSSV